MRKNNKEETKVENSKLAVTLYIILLIIFYLFYRKLEFTTGLGILGVVIDLVVIFAVALILNNIIFNFFKKK